MCRDDFGGYSNNGGGGGGGGGVGGGRDGFVDGMFEGQLRM